MNRLYGASVLITGGTGSFGRWIAQRASQAGAASVTIYSRDETKQEEMSRRWPRFRYVLGDVRDYDRLRATMEGTEIVFHAAALKHVGRCEMAPLEAVKTNVLGTENVCRAALEAKAELVIALSTDKAVNPVGVMGISKAMMEKIVLCYAQQSEKTTFCCVRFGNLLGSRGSVVPIFYEQIAAGGPVTITDPEMTRFLMLLADCSELVSVALNNARSGEIFVKKLPACTVGLLADAVIEWRGLGGNIEKKTLGAYPGEKTHEELLSASERVRAVEFSDHFVIRPEWCRPMQTSIPGEVSAYDSASIPQLKTTAEVISILEKMEN